MAHAAHATCNFFTSRPQPKQSYFENFAYEKEKKIKSWLAVQQVYLSTLVCMKWATLSEFLCLLKWWQWVLITVKLCMRVTASSNATYELNHLGGLR